MPRGRTHESTRAGDNSPVFVHNLHSKQQAGCSLLIDSCCIVTGSHYRLECASCHGPVCLCLSGTEVPLACSIIRQSLQRQEPGFFNSAHGWIVVCFIQYHIFWVNSSFRGFSGRYITSSISMWGRHIHQNPRPWANFKHHNFGTDQPRALLYSKGNSFVPYDFHTTCCSAKRACPTPR